jgi:uncharacterized protein (TIGR02246 family)
MAEMSLEDRLDVMDLVARYAECVDAGDVEGYAALFTSDGVVEYSGGSVQGREEIKAWVDRLAKEGRIGAESGVKHVLGLPVIRGDGERATARTYVVIPRIMPTGVISTRFIGTYKDDVVKQAGRWLLARRVIALELTAKA